MVAPYIAQARDDIFLTWERWSWMANCEGGCRDPTGLKSNTILMRGSLASILWLKHYLCKKALHSFSCSWTTPHSSKFNKELLFLQLLRMTLDFSLQLHVFLRLGPKLSSLSTFLSTAGNSCKTYEWFDWILLDPCDTKCSLWTSTIGRFLRSTEPESAPSGDSCANKVMMKLIYRQPSKSEGKA